MRVLLLLLSFLVQLPAPARAQPPASSPPREPRSLSVLGGERPPSLVAPVVLVVSGASTLVIGMAMAVRGGRLSGAICIFDWGEDGCASSRASRENRHPLGLPAAGVGAVLFAVGVPFLVRRLATRVRWRNREANRRQWTPRLELDPRADREMVVVGVASSF